MIMVLDSVREFGRTFLRGNLTYAVAWIALVGATAMWLNGQIDNEMYVFLVNANLAILGIRRAIR